MHHIGIALTTAQTSDVVRTTKTGTVWFDIQSAGTDEAVTLQYSHDNVTFVTLTADGTAQDTLVTDDLKAYILPGGIYLRALAGTVTQPVNVRVDGAAIDVDQT